MCPPLEARRQLSDALEQVMVRSRSHQQRFLLPAQTVVKSLYLHLPVFLSAAPLALGSCREETAALFVAGHSSQSV